MAQSDQEQQQQQSQAYNPELNSSDSTFNADHFSLSKTSSAPLLLNVDNEQSTNSSEQNISSSDLSQKSSQQQSQQRTNSNFSLKSLFNEIFRTSQGIQMQKKSYFLKTFECVQGKDIVDWLLKNQRASVLSEAKLLCQCFINESYIEPVVTPKTSFVEFQSDQTLYKIGKVGLY